MISVLSTTGKYILQPSLISMHQQSLAWQSTVELWKKELHFFQKLLDLHAAKLTSKDDKKRVDHFQNLMVYYNGEVVDELRKRLRMHETNLAVMLRQENESDVQYFNEHKELMDQAAAFEKSFTEFKHDFFMLIERAVA